MACANVSCTLHRSVESFNAMFSDFEYLQQAFVASFASGEYMHIKNSILVLTKIAPFFPIQYTTGQKLEASVADLIVAEKRDDLKVFAYGFVRARSRYESFMD